MEYEDKLQRKSKRVKRRNFVAKNNRHKGKRHAAASDYRRKSKYPEAAAWRLPLCLLFLATKKNRHKGKRHAAAILSIS